MDKCLFRGYLFVNKLYSLFWVMSVGSPCIVWWQIKDAEMAVAEGEEVSDTLDSYLKDKRKR